MHANQILDPILHQVLDPCLRNLRLGLLLVCIEVQYEAVKFLNRFLINEKVYVQDNLYFIQACQISVQ